MADPLSITLGAIAVTQVVYQFGCETYKIINDIRDAPDDVRRLVSGLEALCNVLQSLQAALGANKDSHPSELRAQMVWDIQEMVEKCMAIFGEIRGATSQWISEDGKQTKRRNFWKSVGWTAVTRENVAKLQMTLNDYKLSLNLACNSLS